MNWRFSCADFTFPLLPHDGALKLIHLLGIHAVDLGLFVDRSHVDPRDVAKDVAGAAKEMKRKLEDAELHVADVFLQTGAEPPVNAANTPDDRIRIANRDLFSKILDFAMQIGARHMTGLPGVRHRGVESSDDWERAVRESNWRVEKARKAGVAYAFEPHVGSITPEPEDAMRLVEQVPGLTITLDYGHFAFAGIDLQRVHPLITHASHVHVRGGAPNRLQTSVKESAIDFRAIARRLRERNYSGHVCLEYVWIDWMDCNRADNISETILLKKLFESE